MRKSFLIFYLFSMLINSIYATQFNNLCIQQMDQRVSHNNMWLTQCNLEDSDVSAILLYLDAHEKIHTLTISKNHLTDKGAALLAKNKYLEVLYIDKNNIGDEGVSALAKHSFHHLDISYNHIGDLGAIALSKLIDLNILIANKNNIGDEGAIALANLHHLKELNLKDNIIGNNGAIALAKNPNITWLQIGNQIKDIGAQALAHGNHSYLEIIGPITNRGANALANHTTVSSLVLIDNKIGDQGASLLANSKNKNLRNLALINNNIGDEGAAALAISQNLQQLVLDHNQIGNDGAFKLAKSASLYALSIAYNHIGPSGIIALKKKFDPFLIAEGNDGPIDYVHSVNKKTAPSICPSVEAIQSGGVDHAQHEADGWVVYSLKNRYHTKEIWQFSMLLKNNYDHEYFALLAGKEALKKFSPPFGPISSDEKMWSCLYMARNEAIGKAVTPP